MPSDTDMTATPRPFIIDTDMGPDDWMAILLLAGSPHVSIQAVTVVGTGLAHVKPGAHNALDLLALVGMPGVPVALGRGEPLDGHHHFPGQWRDSADDLLGIKLPIKNPNAPSSLTAVDMLIEVLTQAAQKISILAIGPLTNLAEALQTDPAIVNQIERVYVMGGAVTVPGNVHATDPRIPNTVAEWNIFADPVAASIAFASGAPISLVPLDATNQAPVTPEFMRHLRKNARSTAAEFVATVLERQRETIAAGQYFFWDPLAAGVARHKDFVGFTEATVAVNTQQGDTLGQTFESPGGTLMQVGSSVDAAQLARFKDVFVRTLQREGLQG
jgi:inosine-uridine nucleoside N-ribohydrolase